jgi:N-acetylglucosaminyl-diphospho-decaprenol L-rhamnosyltransferase
MPTLDVVIVNYNSGEDLRACLESLAHDEKTPLVSLDRVVVVDNASSDQSLSLVPVSSLPLVILRNPVNHGFAAACNQGAHGSRAEFLLFLNPDARLLPRSLDRLIHLLSQPERCRVGICGVQLLDARGEVRRTCMRFPSAARFVIKLLGFTRLSPERFPAYGMTDWPHDGTREVDAVLGAFFLVRRTVYEMLNGFDERYFLYFEEVDFCRRAYSAGWRTLYAADIQACHRGGLRGNARTRRVCIIRREAASSTALPILPGGPLSGLWLLS